MALNFFIPLFQNNGPLEENQAHVFQRNGFLQLTDHYQGGSNGKSILVRDGLAPIDESSSNTEPNDLLKLHVFDAVHAGDRYSVYGLYSNLFPVYSPQHPLYRLAADKPSVNGHDHGYILTYLQRQFILLLFVLVIVGTWEKFLQ